MMTASKSVGVSALSLCATACKATPFRGIAMSPSYDHRPGRWSPVLVQPIEAHCPAGHDPVPGLRRHSFEAVQQHFRGTRKKPVGMRVVGGPQDLVRPDIIGEHLD